MAEHIIGSSAQYMMEVNNSGAVPVAGYSGGTVYPLLVDSSGKLETSATVNVGSITAGSESFIHGKSGTDWYPLIVESGADGGTLVTTASVSVDRVYIASGADIGSVYLKPGQSIDIGSSITIDNVGSPSFKSATAIASGIYTEVWALGGAGSRIEVHGWKVSTDFPGYVKIVTSGTAPTLVSDYYLNYGSGAVIEKTFSSPIVPGAADINIGFGTTVAGSTAVTIYGREVE